MGIHGRFALPIRAGLKAALLGLLVLPCLSGCQLLGFAASALPAPTIPAKYTDLRGQSVAVMVWVWPGGKIEWPQMQLDLANSIQQRLEQAAKTKVHELEGTTFPRSAAAIATLQDDHPDWAYQTIDDVAPKLGVSRVIYIEVENFQTRADASVDLFRGSISGRMKVMRVDHGKATIALSEDDLHNLFPPKGPDEGALNKTDYDMYRGTLKAFATSIGNLFLPHQEDARSHIFHCGRSQEPGAGSQE